MRLVLARTNGRAARRTAEGTSGRVALCGHTLRKRKRHERSVGADEARTLGDLLHAAPNFIARIRLADRKDTRARVLVVTAVEAVETDGPAVRLHKAQFVHRRSPTLPIPFLISAGQLSSWTC